MSDRPSADYSSSLFLTILLYHYCLHKSESLNRPPTPDHKSNVCRVAAASLKLEVLRTYVRK